MIGARVGGDTCKRTIRGRATALTQRPNKK
jgi:hypothetical protein